MITAQTPRLPNAHIELLQAKEETVDLHRVFFTAAKQLSYM